MTRKILEVASLTKVFGGLCAVENVSFDVDEGSITALIGPNGAGKTTMFNLITNVYQRSDGDVLFCDESICDLPANKIAGLGLVRTFQSARVFPGMTTLENVLTGAHLHMLAHPAQQMLWLPKATREERDLVAKADALLDLVNLLAFRDVAATDLPMGAQKLLEVVRALMAQPKLLLLDEPAAGLNDSETEEFAALICAVRNNGISVMVVEHNMSLVMGVADKVLVLDAGRLIAQGTPGDVQNNARVVEAYIGQEFSPQDGD
ncbi:MAG: ABC transporter ATP-binding protein [Xanthobacteraceae bacterium]|nr:MAG: ABC transporter ATP-binding protein [Xanthobacteraceae bacterium]